MIGFRFWLVVLLAAFFTFSAHAGSAKIVKTLPHYLDQKGRHTLHPSLFERDAYQQDLKRHPEKCSGMRFDVQWKAQDLKRQPIRIRLEVRGSKTPPRQSEVFEESVQPKSFFSQWTSLKVADENFKRTGQILAWRITVWNGETQLAEQRSFLW